MNVPDNITAKLEAMNTVKLCFLPTPLEKQRNPSPLFKGVNLFFKRDDQTGLAMGGNKARKLEWIMAHVLEKKAKSIITWGGIHSNWCRQVAAAANICRVKPILVLLKKPGFQESFDDGNPLLDSIFAADIRIAQVGENQKLMELAAVKDIIDLISHEEKENGNKPYIAPIGGSLPEGSMKRPLGALSYVNAFLEIARQAETHQVSFDAVVAATGSGSTHAGLLAGAKIFSPQTKVVGISVSEDKATISRYIETITRAALTELGVDNTIKPEEIIVFTDYIDEGYGILNKAAADKIRLIAETEGLLLDPVYTGKAMVGLIDLIDKGYFKKGENILFLHTGGTPSLFSYGKELQKFFP